MKPRGRRLGWVALGVASAVLAGALVLDAFRANVMFYVTPSQVDAAARQAEHRLRLGGLVERGSLRRGADGLTVQFVVTDTVRQVPVSYRGLLPDLFREGSGVVAQGRFGRDGRFHADEVLARHDERYVPPGMPGGAR
jgi:cytochrome c-type biogenesis protein CcmE